MAKDEGLLIKFHESRKDVFIKYTRENKFKSFSDAFTIHNWKAKGKEIVIISFSKKTFNYIALVTKKHKVVTEKNKLEFSHIIPLDGIFIKDVEDKYRSLESFFIYEGGEEGKKLPPKVLENILSIIINFNPHLEEKIERLKTLQKFSNHTLVGENIALLLQEREALASALDIFDSSKKLRKDVLNSWLPNSKNIVTISEEEKTATLDLSSNKPFSFLDGIDRTLQEETTLQHDLMNFGNLVGTHKGGHSTFNIGSRKLNIFYANKTKLETAIGVDLIYYNEKYESFILVQYKLLKESNDEFIYRPDKQMNEELSRMNNFMKKYKNNKSITSNNEYRLNDDGFIFKFVENKGIKLTSSELIQGLYITREYMNFIISDKAPKGLRGGTIISSKLTPRYLTNSEFVTLMNRGFLGTKKFQSEVLRELIKGFFHTGKALLFAVESDDKLEEM